MADGDVGEGSSAGRPPIDGILEAALYAPDLDAAEHFYGLLLGLQRLHRNGNRHVFYAVGRTVLLIFNPAATEIPLATSGLPVPTHGARGPGHVCFSVPPGRMDRGCGKVAGHWYRHRGGFYLAGRRAVDLCARSGGQQFGMGRTRTLGIGIAP